MSHGVSRARETNGMLMAGRGLVPPHPSPGGWGHLWGTVPSTVAPGELWLPLPVVLGDASWGN